MVNKHSKLMGLLLIVLVASALISLGIVRYALSLEQILQILTAKLTALLTVFKALEQPIIGRVEKGKIWLDLRSVADFKALLDTVEKL